MCCSRLRSLVFAAVPMECCLKLVALVASPTRATIADSVSNPCIPCNAMAVKTFQSIPLQFLIRSSLTYCGETGSLKMHCSRLYGCNTRTKCCELMPEILPASMVAADARVSESITKNRTRAFSLARCSNSIRSGVHSDTCCKFIQIENDFHFKFSTPFSPISSIRNSTEHLPDYKKKCLIGLAVVWRRRHATSLDYTIRPKILPVLLGHRTDSVLTLMS